MRFHSPPPGIPVPLSATDSLTRGFSVSYTRETFRRVEETGAA